MASRRNGSKPEEQVWSKIVTALGTLESAHSTCNDRVSHVNELVKTLPSSLQNGERDFTPTPESQLNLRSLSRKLLQGLNEVKGNAEDELKAIQNALESLGILIALKTPDNIVVQDKRNKRSRVSSPASSARATPPPSLTGSSSGLSLSLSIPPRPQTQPFSREPKARREALAGQLPLQPGRKVAFRPSPNKGAVAGTGGSTHGSDGGRDGDGNEWILAVVKRCINQDKNRYEVQDVDLTEDNKPGPCYNTTLRALIPLPDPDAPIGSITHPSSYEEFRVGNVVMAQYPDTTTFYRAEVMVTPSQTGRNGSKSAVYRLKFEDDDGQVRSVAAHLVVEWPGDT